MQNRNKNFGHEKKQFFQPDNIIFNIVANYKAHLLAFGTLFQN